MLAYFSERTTGLVSILVLYTHNTNITINIIRDIINNNEELQ